MSDRNVQAVRSNPALDACDVLQESAAIFFCKILLIVVMSALSL